MLIQKILDKGIKSSNLTKIKLPNSRSHIIQLNNNVIFCSNYKGLKGLFRKDIEETEKFGRRICGKVKEELKNEGFFTSDELPNYGVSENETRIIFEKTKAGDSDLIVIFAYNKKEAEKTKDLLDKLLKNVKK